MINNILLRLSRTKMVWLEAGREVSDMQTHRNLFEEMLVRGIGSLLGLAHPAVIAQLYQPTRSGEHQDRLGLRSGYRRRRLWLVLALVIFQSLVVNQAHALPNPIDGTLGGGRITTG